MLHGPPVVYLEENQFGYTWATSGLSRGKSVWLYIRGVQQNDEELAIVVKWMEGGEVPDENVLALGSPAMKFYWVNKNLMKFKNTILMYSKGDKDLILTPRGLVESVLNLAHNVPPRGGGGGGTSYKGTGQRQIFLVQDD